MMLWAALISSLFIIGIVVIGSLFMMMFPPDDIGDNDF